MDLSAFRSVIESFFTDKADIYHYSSKTNEDGTTENLLPSEPSVPNVPCKLSFSMMETPADGTSDNEPIVDQVKLFYSLSSDFHAGDYVIARRLQNDGTVLQTYKGIIGLGAYFQTHVEAVFEVKEFA